MALYLLSYDITEKNHDYQSLWNWLNGLNSVRLLYSEWAVPWQNDSTALELINTALQHVMKGDGVLACELFNNSTIAWRTLRITTEEFQALLRQYARSW